MPASGLILSVTLLLSSIACTFSSSLSPSYKEEIAQSFVGAQQWNESGWYADKGFLESYYGYFCLCECHSSPQGIFCKGGGVKPDGITPVASFLGVFAHEKPSWIGNVVAFNNTKPFADTIRLDIPGGPSNYTGVSQSLEGSSFVWRGTMSGVNCKYAGKCTTMCEGGGDNKQHWKKWYDTC